MTHLFDVIDCTLITMIFLYLMLLSLRIFSLFHQFSEINRIIIGMKIKPVKQRAYGIYIDILSALKRCNERSDERAEEKSTNNFKLQYLMMHTIL